MMQELMEGYQLPTADVQVNAGPDGEYRLDVAYVRIKFAVEVDGYCWHFTPEHQRRDHARRNKLVAGGWQFLVYTWLDLKRRPAEVAAQIVHMHERLTRLAEAASR
jgi:very-short-patch-repair endonuclease